MAGLYEKLESARFAIEKTRSGDIIRVKAPRPIGSILFLLFWLGGWTFGGVWAIKGLMQEFQPFLMFWLGGWALGWAFAARTLAWMLFGSETLTVVGRDLEIGYHVGPFSRRKLYRGADIRNLKPSGFVGSSHTIPPLRGTSRVGAVQFDYGTRTVYAAAPLGEAEGRMVVQQLGKRLPTGALAPPPSGS